MAYCDGGMGEWEGGYVMSLGFLGISSRQWVYICDEVDSGMLTAYSHSYCIYNLYNGRILYIRERSDKSDLQLFTVYYACTCYSYELKLK